MEPKKKKMELMKSLNLDDNGDHQSSSEDSLDSDVIYEDSPVPPRIGSEYQAEIPNLATEDERRKLIADSLNGSTSHGYGYPIMVGLALPIMWASSSEVNKKEEQLQMQSFSDSETRRRCGDMQSQVTSTCPINNNTSKCDPTFQNQHAVVPAVQNEWDSNQAHDNKMAPCMTEEELFLLGLYIFGKSINLLSWFLGTKTIGDALSYYYGKFYKRVAYKRWSDCKKEKSRKCILGEHIFQGWRQQELISRLKSNIPEESHDSLVEVFKSFGDSQTSLKEFVFALKSIVGTEVFVEAVGVGKGKHDLTGFVMDQSEPNQALSIHRDLPTGKDFSSLASKDMIKLLTGDSRRSKAGSNVIFWEAVWPRLLGKGWHSEQPKDVRAAKNCIVFLMPGIKRFSRSELTKGTHYFDSVSDVLKKVSADPVLLALEADGIEHGLAAEENGGFMDVKLNQDSPPDGYQELPKFPIIDTTLVEGEEPFNVLELRKLPADANFSFALSHHAPNMMSYSSSEKEDASDTLSDDQEDCGRVSPEIKEIKMVVNDNIIDLTGIYGTKTKPERRKYLSPAPESKRRRLTCCSSKQSSRRSISFSRGCGLENEKRKPLSTSKPAAVAVGATFQDKTIARCSTKEKLYEKKMDASPWNSDTSDQQNGRMIRKTLIENRKFEHMADAVAKIHSKVTSNEMKHAKERAVSRQPEPAAALEANPPRRQGTRNRPPTARALEAVAFGLLGSGKRKKGDPKDERRHGEELAFSASSKRRQRSGCKAVDVQATRRGLQVKLSSGAPYCV
ncbi:unnamed protein product [Urochloa decumbens]|uniref:SANT domain-containing protein n=1 Tax=Urochloa decumbens TaxID=240449 RepID=A0ABC9GFB0_9POAL